MIGLVVFLLCRCLLSFDMTALMSNWQLVCNALATRGHWNKACFAVDLMPNLPHQCYLIATLVTHLHFFSWDAEWLLTVLFWCWCCLCWLQKLLLSPPADSCWQGHCHVCAMLLPPLSMKLSDDVMMLLSLNLLLARHCSSCWYCHLQSSTGGLVQDI